MSMIVEHPVGPRPRERGAALVIGMLLLVILTLLAVTGMSTATTELVMAGNEQHRMNASQAASAGVEQAIARIASVPTSPGAEPIVTGPTALEGSAIDFYTTESRYVGEEIGLPQSSADKFLGLHYSIRSTGTSARNASDTQIQGVLVVAPAAGGGSDFGRIGTGLTP